MKRSLTVRSLLGLGAVFCTAANFVSCGNPQTNEPSQVTVTGGREVGVTSKLPTRTATVALTSRKLATEGRAFCTGVLIKPTIILTAAHCVTDEWGKVLPLEHISFGNKVSSEPMSLNKMIGVAVHRKWNAQSLDLDEGVPSHDLALVRMNAAFPKGKPVAIDDGKNLSLDGRDSKKLVIAGYGVSASRDLDDTGTLRTATMKVKKYEVESGVILLEGFPRPGFALDPTGFGDFRRKRVKSGACAGDSGGPAYVKAPSPSSSLSKAASQDEWVVSGITSYGYEMALEGGQPDRSYCVGANGYTYLPPYRRQILAAAEALFAAPVSETYHQFHFSEQGFFAIKSE